MLSVDQQYQPLGIAGLVWGHAASESVDRLLQSPEALTACYLSAIA